MTERTSLLAGAAPRAMFHAPASAHPMLRGPQVAYAPDEGEGGGGMSVEQAVAALESTEDNDPANAAPAEAAAGDEGEQIDAGDQPAGEPGDEPEQLAEGDESDQSEAVAPLEAPTYWSKEAKAKFAALDPELQAVVLAQEGPREAATAKVKSEAAEATKAAAAEVGKVQQLAEALADRLPGWISTFESRWGTKTPDWVAYANEHGAEAMTLVKTQFEQERSQLLEAQQATQIAQGQAHEAFVKAERVKLAELAPELAHPETGPAKRTEVAQYLGKLGIDPVAIRSISAAEMTIAHKAMLYDQAQAKLKAPKPTPKPAAAPAARSSVRPAASAGAAGSPATQRVQTLGKRFAQTKSIDDAVALLDAKG